jgi:zinc protease
VVAGDVDEPALDVLAAVLGGQAGRLFLRLREQMGVGYDVYAANIVSRDRGAFMVHATCAPEAVVAAEAALVDELQGLHRRAPDKAEIDRAVSALSGGRASGLQRASARAGCMAIDEVLGLDGTRYLRSLKGIESVTVADLRRVIADHMVQLSFRTVVLVPET